ncbi:hypothetical protein A3D00_00540 [Candidatus Woesebacteria bacterium RIFCSPHIGHO2_02_FULL_38_9]|uniref:DUF1648 domain-containing protein n=1 Tax=Candidatus Woesebacteria bacterium RIFCSPHIGHO2_01_FULL_39_28 TaxID=1802496 RepID=A0A1F7YHA6_9BACT|nr:MAG: hypothetical protein A2627_04160 [Candidatus Woesebacteria bacterium RIFCSPHIGHO2_01_FULL_39_28]OGM33218.1 MAG: hypothetical protein A3D00_00540 [Candidatus Woesebacteria bacterium RIFCSPHIGHO2_02_FULL_38_9]OGM58689.1 MAG: hypothetical protein A3A50_02815 [Candidatus Woesebacteria bacterium RIFCSPLOWO2_01_FULL_38_20]
MKRLSFSKFILASVTVNLITGALVLILLNHIPPQAPIFYGRPQSEKQLADKLTLILPPFISTIFAVVNFFIIKIVKDDFLKKVLMGVTISVTILSTITVVKIIFLVGNL